MKKFFGLYDKNHETELKNKLISFSGIESKYVNFLEISIDSTNYIHITYIDDTNYVNKKDLVFIHGWAGSSLSFFKTFKELSKYFRLIAVDLPGMGCSSRDNFNYKDLNEVEDYFLFKLKFTFDQLGIEQFILLGHSFGGYIASLFAVRHKEMIEKLILISPVGISSSYADITSTKIEDFLQYLFFKSELTASTFYKVLGFGGSYIFNKICTQEKFKGLINKEEFNTYKDFLLNLIYNHPGSDKSLFLLFNKNLQAFKPLTYYHQVLKEMKILLLYGDGDWNPRKQADDLLPGCVEIEIISNSGHLIQTDNYDELCRKIIDFVNKKDEEEKKIDILNADRLNGEIFEYGKKFNDYDDIKDNKKD